MGDGQHSTILNHFLIICWVSWLLIKSMLAVASSISTIRLLFRITLHMHNNCFYPTNMVLLVTRELSSPLFLIMLNKLHSFSTCFRLNICWVEVFSESSIHKCWFLLNNGNRISELFYVILANISTVDKHV